MANLTSTLTVRLLDQISGPAKAASAAILGIGRSVTAANARGGMGLIGAHLTAMATATEKAASRMRSAAHSMSAISFPTLFLGAMGARSVYEFEKVANTIEAVTNITKTQRNELQTYMQSLNALFPFTNAQIAQSALELGRAGLSFDQIMGALKGTLNLALAGNIELRESSDIATNVLTAMRLPMKTTEQVAASLTRVNDVLAFAANQSNIDVRQLGETFKYVGPMAAAAGMSVEQVAAAAMVMGNNGIRASEAGVALRSALVRMVKPTRDMQGVLARANIDIRDFVRGGRQINAQAIVDSLATDGVDAKPFVASIERALKDPKFARNLPGLTQRLVEIVGGGGAMDRAKLAENISDALTAAGSEVDLLGFVKALQDKGIDLGEIARIFDTRQGARLITLLAGFKDLGTFLHRLETEARGSTDRAARIMQQGVVGAWARFHASIENLSQAIARSGVLETVTGMLNRFAGAIEGLAKVNPAWLEFGTYAAVIAAAAPGVPIVGASIATIVGWLLKLGGAAGLAGAGTIGAGAGAAAAARGGLLKSMLGRALPWAVPGYFAADWAWKAIGGHAAVEELFREKPLPGSQIMERMRAMDRTEAERLRFDQIKGRLDAMGGYLPGAPGLAGPIRAPIPAMPGEAGQAAQETGSAYVNGLRDEMERAVQMAREYAARIQRELSFTANPRVRLGIDGGDLRGLHGDIGVDPVR